MPTCHREEERGGRARKDGRCQLCVVSTHKQGTREEVGGGRGYVYAHAGDPRERRLAHLPPRPPPVVALCHHTHGGAVRSSCSVSSHLEVHAHRKLASRRSVHGLCAPPDRCIIVGDATLHACDDACGLRFACWSHVHECVMSPQRTGYGIDRVT